MRALYELVRDGIIAVCTFTLFVFLCIGLASVIEVAQQVLEWWQP